MKKKLAAAAAVMTALFSMTGCATTADSAATGANGATSLIMIVGYMVIIIGVMYFVAIRPQKKEQKRTQTMLNSMEVGDSVVTTSGFYGVVIDMTEEDVIVEFGNNKNSLNVLDIPSTIFAIFVSSLFLNIKIITI